ncbi:YIP1 family protein [Haloimpatiens sp. FM7315]|uniref:YIP1 family protein n=1 Tax=Haloimpatiens sp. FM7315 TaxID=3298609 RepID=UPI0035A3D441
MTFCKNCGAPLKEGDKFCGECGAVIEDKSSVSKNTSNKETIELLQNLFNYSKKILAKPITTTSNESKYLTNAMSMYLLAIISIISGIIDLLSVKSIITNVNGLWSTMNFKLSYLFEELCYSPFNNEIPYAKFFFGFTLYFLLSSVALILACHLIINYIFKVNTDLFDSVKITASSLIPFILGKLLCSLLSYISITLGFIGIFIGIILFILSFYKGIVKALKIEENKAAFMVPICLVISFLCDYVLIKFFINLLTH